jgi:hypothetical protein
MDYVVGVCGGLRCGEGSAWPGGAEMASNTGGGKSKALERLNLQTWSLTAATRKPPITDRDRNRDKGKRHTQLKMSIRERDRGVRVCARMHAHRLVPDRLDTVLHLGHRG